MATNYKVLGQLAAGSATYETLYTVPSATESVVSTIVVANRTASAKTYRLAVVPNGTAVVDQSFLAYDVALAANDSTALTLGICLDATDTIRCYASAGSAITFTAFGSEIA
jgi:hypothetical protein